MGNGSDLGLIGGVLQAVGGAFELGALAYVARKGVDRWREYRGEDVDIRLSVLPKAIASVSAHAHKGREATTTETIHIRIDALEERSDLVWEYLREIAKAPLILFSSGVALSIAGAIVGALE